jgi:hypothetical protein
MGAQVGAAGAQAMAGGNLPLSQPASQQDTRWKAILDPVVSSPILAGRQLDGIVLVTGSNTINHGLGRKLQGYFVVLNSASATFYDTQSTNASTQLTLALVSSADTTISLWVY